SASVRKRPWSLQRGHAADLGGRRGSDLRVLLRNLVEQAAGHGKMRKEPRQNVRREGLYLRVLPRAYYVLHKLHQALMILNLHPQVFDVELGTAQAAERVANAAELGIIKLFRNGNCVSFGQFAEGILRLGVVSNRLPRKLPQSIAAGFLFGKSLQLDHGI